MEAATSPRSAALHRFWQRAIGASGKHHVPATPAEWNEQVYYLSGSGIGTEEALQYLYTRQPSFYAFLHWLDEAAPTIPQLPPHTQPVLSQQDRDFWDANGYLVVRNAATEAQCAAARDAIWQYLGADAATPAGWYAHHAGKNGLMLRLFRHPALEVIRYAPVIRKAYRELYGGEDIYLLVDKVSFNPPETPTYKFAGSALHWDASLVPPIPFVLQGLLYLNDVAAADGAFHCVPGFHKPGYMASWMASLPPGADPRATAAKTLQPVAVPGNAGDLVIWHQALPHCATPNKGATPRMVQYIAYKPVQALDSAVWM